MDAKEREVATLLDSRLQSTIWTDRAANPQIKGIRNRAFKSSSILRNHFRCDECSSLRELFQLERRTPAGTARVGSVQYGRKTLKDVASFLAWRRPIWATIEQNICVSPSLTSLVPSLCFLSSLPFIFPGAQLYLNLSSRRCCSFASMYILIPVSKQKHWLTTPLLIAIAPLW